MFDVFYIGKKPGLFLHEKPAESIQDACDQSRTRYCWIVNYLADYSNWDWLWEPVPWQSHQRHAWASQWQKDSGTYLVPKTGYTETNYHSKQIQMQTDILIWQNINSVEQFDYSWHPDYTDPPYNYEFGTQWQKTGGPRYPMMGASETKYVSQSGSIARAQALSVYVIDHMCSAIAGTVNTISTRATVRRVVRYFDNYLDTLTRIARNAANENLEYIWICSSICDYNNFDFTWHPNSWQNHMLHVFPSNEQKFGDTFFMHVPTFVSKIKQFELLEWYDLNFVQDCPVSRLPMPVIKHSDDTHVSALNKYNFAGPYALYTVTDTPKKIPAINLWRPKYKTIVPLSTGSSSVIVPRPALGVVRSQLYDYPYIDKTHKSNVDDPIDIVFVSNGEPNADQHFLHLTSMTCNLKNRLHRVDGVKGRVASQRAAAQVAKTDWYFVVPAKLEVDKQFDWNWQPDRMQQAKHYIFHAGNPVNGLVYGHQATVAYNKKLVLETTGNGLDFTMEKAHEVVPIISGVANYADSPWVAWRTAFREVIKLQHSLPDVESEYRLKVWLTEDSGTIANGHWSHKGAEDAVEYYKEVQGDFGALMKSYEWSWLASYALIKRNLTLDN